MKNYAYLLLIALFIIPTVSFAQDDEKDPEKSFFMSGMYLQWGWNVVWYTKSDIHFKMANGDKFTLHEAIGDQRTSFDAIYKKPLEISIPQYNYRIGFYINKAQTRALEINFDHTKYVVRKGQTLRVTGTYEGVDIDEDKVIDPDDFLTFEHTDGANFLHINYVEQHALAYSERWDRDILTYVWKVGAGINIPRTDFTHKGDRLNNRFHVAGFNISAEGGLRVYPARTFFLELTGKGGYVNYLNALADTTTDKGNRAHHHFGYVEIVFTLGGDINFYKSDRKKKKKQNS